MAIIGFIFGSVLGFFAAVIAWAFLGMPLMTAVALYASCSLGFGLLTAALGMMRADDAQLAPQAA